MNLGEPSDGLARSPDPGMSERDSITRLPTVFTGSG